MNLLVEEERIDTWAGLASMLKSSSRPGLSIFTVFMAPSRPVKYFPSWSFKATKPPFTSKEYSVCGVTSGSKEPLHANILPVPFLKPYFFTTDKGGRSKVRRWQSLAFTPGKPDFKWKPTQKPNGLRSFYYETLAKIHSAIAHNQTLLGTHQSCPPQSFLLYFLICYLL